MSTSAPQVSAEDVKKSIDLNEQVVLLDVRTPGEFSRGKIAGSINLPVGDVLSKVESVIADKNQKVYVYCLSGSRSDIAVQQMVQLGYTNVFSLTQGLLAWRSKQYPVGI
jgi:rhodanese-related sulfurtransferase